MSMMERAGGLASKPVRDGSMCEAPASWEHRGRETWVMVCASKAVTEVAGQKLCLPHSGDVAAASIKDSLEQAR